jgi:hypothetical protein
MVTFQYVPVDEATKATMQIYRDKFEALYKEISELPSNRGLSVCLTKLEEASMWLNKSITNNS